MRIHLNCFSLKPKNIDRYLSLVVAIFGDGHFLWMYSYIVGPI